MPTQPQSPISRKGSKPGSNPPLGPGTNTNPSGPGPHQPTPARRSSDSVPPQPPHGASRHSETKTKEE